MKLENNKPLALCLSFFTVLIAGVVLVAVYSGGSFDMNFSNSIMFGPNTSTDFGYFGMVVFGVVTYILVRIRTKYLGFVEEESEND